jgi:hypothetical protein
MVRAYTLEAWTFVSNLKYLLTKAPNEVFWRYRNMNWVSYAFADATGGANRHR